MEYEEFTNEWKKFEEWEEEQSSHSNVTRPRVPGYRKLDLVEDRVNSPSHYTSGKYEAIDVIGDAVRSAPTNEAAFLQGQVLKYLLRVWLKDNSIEDLKKARWYLDRLIDKL
jgi:hypothetical protein